MADQVTLHGYTYSVYTRIVRLVLEYKEIEYKRVEINPFSDVKSPKLKLHPFGRVPVLSHGSFEIYETSAISRYIENTFSDPSLLPDSSKAIARMDQVISIIDSYGYRPMIMQVFSHRVFLPLEGEPSSEEEIVLGLKDSEKVLTALEIFTKEGLVLNGQDLTLADFHLAPMIDYFIQAEEGQKLFSSYPNLINWWEQVSNLEAMKLTEPDLYKLQ